MFSTQEYLDKKTGPYGIGRESFLQLLVQEFQQTSSVTAKQEVLANLANFAYDPINYDYMRSLNVIDLLLDCLNEADEKIIEFAMGGLCNICLDKTNKEHILKNDGVNLIKKHLSSSNEETVVNAITAMMYLVTPASKKHITALPVVDAMLQFEKSHNKRISNLATVFLADYCTEAERQQARAAQEEWEAQTHRQG